MKRSQIAFVFFAIAVVGATPVSASSFYAGAAGGASSLRPDVGTSSFSVDSNVAFGAGGFIGYDFNNRFSLELGYNYLGGAKLVSEASSATVDYSAISASALYYFYGDARDIAQRSGFSVYGRLGVNSMKHDTTIPLTQQDTTGIGVGIGAEWPLSHALSVRGELASFDGDAQAARVAVLYRLRSGAQRGRVATQSPRTPPRAPQLPQAAPQVAPPAAPQVQQPEITRPTVPAPPVPQAPQTSVVQSTCAAPVANEPVNSAGCALFSGKVNGVDFASGTASLTPVAMQSLDRLAQNLLSHPSVVIEIQAHTESFNNPARATAVAKQRTLAVARYLASRGVPVQRLRARAYGHSFPLAPDNSVAGRRQNNRVELKVLR